MSVSYILREGFSGFQRAKLSMAVSIITTGIALILLGVFGIVRYNAGRLVDSIRNRVDLDVFLDEPIRATALDSLKMKILAIRGIESARYISKEEAVKRFQTEFGEDIRNVLSYNPLPASFKIQFAREYRTAAHVDTISQTLKAIPGISDVIYQKSLLDFLDKRARIVYLVTLSLGIIIALSALFLVANTIRLAIYSKRNIIETMKLVGATPGFIRTPFLIEGIIQGFIGGVLAAAFLYAVITLAQGQLSSEFSDMLIVDPALYGLLILAGIVLGLFGSLVSIRRFLYKAVTI